MGFRRVKIELGFDKTDPPASREREGNHLEILLARTGEGKLNKKKLAKGL